MFLDLFRKKPAPADVMVLHDSPCPSCDMADFVVVGAIEGKRVVRCVNCKSEWFFYRLRQKEYSPNPQPNS